MKEVTTMLLEFGTAGNTDGGGGSTSARGKAEQQLIDLIQAALPELTIRSSRLDQSGGDHLLLVVNDEHAFRFPRVGMHDMRLETEVLRQLRRRSPVAIPVFDHTDPAGRFAGYRFIDGEPLTASRFARLDDAARNAVLDDIARFLIALHDLSQAEVGWSGEWPGTWTAAQFAYRGLSGRLPLIARHAPQLAASVENFYAAYRLDHAERVAIIHGDLVCEHILLDRKEERLAGIIDFGDVALGDPAQDLLGLWSYGADAVARVIELYDPRRGDPGLLRRSRNHFVRYRLDRLFESLSLGIVSETPATIAAIEALLTPSTRYDQ
ncbi:phosphotransferase family protein [Sphingomonas bacterium]|uniref:phosphotransferase family protein n=1 Tax=Sphingomonas bacterium TaxID=1895847 RepID=UPI001575F2A5|nr:phosphotransferase [Sphingomonas bacterium]